MDDFTTRVSLAKIVKDNGLKEEYMPDEPEKIMISLSDVNRPGLVLAAGFYDHFEPKRIQTLSHVRKELTTIESRSITKMKLVPQRGWNRVQVRAFSGVRGSPFSKHATDLCSAPWYS